MNDKKMTGVVLALAMFVVLVAAPVACKTVFREASAPANKGASNVPAGVLGTYTLKTVDGEAIPCAPMHQGQRGPQILLSTITLNEDGTFRSTMSYGKSSGDTIKRDFEGTYKKQGEEYVFQWKGAGQTTAKIEGNVFTMNNEGMIFVSEK